MLKRLSAGALTLVIVLLGWLAALPGVAAAPSPPSPPPPRPWLLEASQAPRAARIMRQTSLSYAPGMTAAARDRDMLQQIVRAKRLLGVDRLVELRRQTLPLVAADQEVSWEYLRRRRFPGGDRVGMTLNVPVWVPARALRLTTYSGFEKKWQTVALLTPRPSGFIWHVSSLADINDKAGYRPARLQFELNSRFAPLAALLLDYIFREGCYDVSRRVPLLVVRGGEDAYAVSARSGPVAAECLSFPDEAGGSLAATVAVCHYDNLSEIYHGHHSKTSNHRLGLALDLNDYNFRDNGVVDGTPNPISHALRQYHRDAMHRLDARQMPSWVYRAGKWLGMRLPQEWVYFGYNTDWEHVDVGTK